MPATEFSSVSVPFACLGRNQVHHAMDSGAGAGSCTSKQQEMLLLAFERCVADLFRELSASADDPLSLSWVRRLLDSFLVCYEEFRALLLDQPLVTCPPLDRIVADFSDRAVKALDICNAARDGIDQLRRWRAHLEIVLAALRPAAPSSRQGISKGKLRRARKALADLAVLMLDDRDAGPALSHRNRSFGRSSPGAGSSSSSPMSGRHLSNFRSLSWSVSRSWSAARQLQAIGSNVAAPRSQEVVATSGFAVPVYTVSAVLLFTMWSLVAAIPCQDRGLQANFSIPRTFPWAAPIMSLHERIVEESKKRDRKSSTALLKEIQQMERCTHQLTELIQSIQFPMSAKEDMELGNRVEELAQICEALEELDPLERQVKEVFLRIMRGRTEGLNCFLHPAR